MRGLVAFEELSSLGDASFLDRSQVNLKQGLVFFALLLIPLSQPDDLSKDLNIEAIALGFLKNLLLFGPFRRGTWQTGGHLLVSDDRCRGVPSCSYTSDRSSWLFALW